jgi:hypothetical protein
MKLSRRKLTVTPSGRKQSQKLQRTRGDPGSSPTRRLTLELKIPLADTGGRNSDLVSADTPMARLSPVDVPRVLTDTPNGHCSSNWWVMEEP